MEEKEYAIPGSDAKVFLNKFELDMETIKQVKRVITQPSVFHSRFMPDCHKGMGVCIGFTSILQDKIVPRYLGGDIGCGILAYNVGKDFPLKKLKRFDTVLRERVPMGGGKDGLWDVPRATDTNIETICKSAQALAEEFATAFAEKFSNPEIWDHVPKYSKEWMQTLCTKVRSSYEYDLRGLGTLGGGNHFWEIDFHFVKVKL